jgi:eukaryotic-like serine/threonine-protein kinase
MEPEAMGPDLTTVRHPDPPARRPRRHGEPSPRHRRSTIALTALAVLLVVAGVVGLLAWQRPPADPSDAGSGSTSPPASTASANPDGQPARGEMPAGFTACGDALCPTAPMCWRGLVQEGDVGHPPASEKCSQPHYWETFLAYPLPADARTDYDLSHLMERPDFQDLCSDEAMASRSVDPAATEGWRREAWPIEADAYTIVVHCLAGDGETPGAVFTSA